ncbi:MAG: rhodanese-like domain-containing protein [Phycisphaerales bacterium]
MGDEVRSGAGGRGGAGGAVVDVSPALVREWMDGGKCVLVDVREDFEHGEERIPGSELRALSGFDAAAIRNAHAGKRVVFHCRTGRRSREAGERFAAAGGGDGEDAGRAFHLAGGIEAWKGAGLEVDRSGGAGGLPLMRQVQIVAGGLVVLGVVLSLLVWEGLVVIALFVGCGLVFAGVSGWCGMARLLAVMPWNRGVRGGG